MFSNFFIILSPTPTQIFTNDEWLKESEKKKLIHELRLFVIFFTHSTFRVVSIK